ncbi:MAG: helix-turn-helix domain-containing protein, partial [Gemmatimonadaceae bacterium]
MAAGTQWRPRRLTAAQLEERRLAAGRLFRAGRLSQAQVARRLGVTRQSVSRWYAAWAADGRAGLRQRPHPGRSPAIDDTAWARLAAVLSRGALAGGFATERWALRRIAAVAERELGVRHHCRSSGPILRARGWSPQVPAVRARERDAALVRAWLRRDWPALAKELAASGARLPSWTRRVTRFGPRSGPPGRRGAARRCCAASAGGARSRASGSSPRRSTARRPGATRGTSSAPSPASGSSPACPTSGVRWA